jgi:hypothetical protein
MKESNTAAGCRDGVIGHGGEAFSVRRALAYDLRRESG